MFAETANRVHDHTSHDINQQIEQRTEARIERYRYTSIEQIDERLEELEQEWDVERVLQTNFATLSIVGALLTSTVNRRWAILALGVPAFMVQHSLQGWCPPLAVLRRLGFRTAKEISDERFALESLRGDFDMAGRSRDADELIDAVRE